jgi:MHS family proline/betaine transporter-like MFS transporter
MLCAICALVLSSYPLFLALQSGSFAILLAAQLAFAAMGGALFGLLFLLLADLFKDNWQSLGMAVGFTLPTAVFGGSAPVVCAYLVDATGLLSAPALYIVCAGLIAAPVAYQLAYGVKPARRRTSLAA